MKLKNPKNPTNTDDTTAEAAAKNSDPATDTPKANIATKTIDATEAAELLADLQRTRADFENYRKQVEAQREQAFKIGAESTVLKLLPLLDDIYRAFATAPEALAPVQKSLDKALAELKLEKIPTSEDTDFNPDIHEAISMDDGDGTREVIAEELRPGYLYEGNVIRAAMVRVKKVD